MPDPLIVYCYRQISDADVFCDLLKLRFRETGHEREIEFRFWDCYKKEPGRDGDIYIFDGMVLSALADKGYIRRLPDIIDMSGIFEWVLNGSKVRKKTYGIPFMLCANVLICRKDENAPVRDLNRGEIAAPMKSMVGEYYVFSYFNSPDKGEGSLRTLRHLKDLIGGIEMYERSRFVEYDGVERFNRGDCKYLLGFTEDLRFLPSDEYKVRPANISDSLSVELPLNYVNYISVGSRVSGERLLDCLDMIEIITSADFFRDYCTAEGQIRYILPANEKLYAGLAEFDDVYWQLYDIVRNEYNCVLRYGKDFYEEFPRKSAELRELLAEKKDETGKIAI